MSDNLIVYMVFTAVAFLIMPIFLNFNVFFDFKSNKYYFGIYLFKFIKVYGGYFQLTSKEIVFHLSNKKAAILPYSKLIDTKNTFKITRGFEITRYAQISEFGDADDIEIPISVCSLNQIIFAIIYGYFKVHRPIMYMTSTTLMVESEDAAKVSTNIVAVFNMIIIITATIKIILEKIIQNVKRKRNKN